MGRIEDEIENGDRCWCGVLHSTKGDGYPRTCREHELPANDPAQERKVNVPVEEAAQS